MAKRPPLEPATVCEFVNDAHGNFERVKEMLEAEPNLLNAAWDWGGGDWETGLGAAAHMGRKDIALYLIGRGARVDIFAAAMLGKIDLVRSFLDAQPEALGAAGPHGISLLSHAKKGGKDAAEVLKLLLSLAA